MNDLPWFGKRTPSQTPAQPSSQTSARTSTVQIPASYQPQSDRADDTRTALARGQLPGYVRQRLDTQRTGALPWTSDLSVNEWLLMKNYKFRPLGLVMGSSYYHVGYSKANFSGSWGSGEVRSISNALYQGRHLALTRMSQEAKELGANAVVGVRLETKMPSYAGHETEFVAIGTAVAMEGLAPSANPVLCTVSGQDLAKLLAAGAIPVSLALGVSVYYQYTTARDTWREQSWSNQEMPMFTESVYQTRHTAMRNMIHEAVQAGGSGVLAHETKLHVYEVEVERGENDKRTDHILEFVSIGTVVSSTRQVPPLDIETVLSLSSNDLSVQTDLRIS